MDFRIDARLHDRQALEEIELYADVLIAVAGSHAPLSTAELDRVLGLAATEHTGGGPRSEAGGRRLCSYT